MTNRLFMPVLILALGVSGGGAAQEPEQPADIVAAQVRAQGHACEPPVTAEHDRAASKPDRAVWTLMCKNARYRVRLTPDMAADIEEIQ